MTRAEHQGIAAREISIELVKAVGRERLGRELLLTASELQRALDPDEFVRVRIHRGGPAPQEIARVLKERDQQQEQNRQWLRQQRSRIDTSLATLDLSIAQWSMPIPHI
ncbi:hypothetical protein D3C73_1022410 [compost metagenome]